MTDTIGLLGFLSDIIHPSFMQNHLCKLHTIGLAGFYHAVQSTHKPPGPDSALLAVYYIKPLSEDSVLYQF